MMRTAEPTRMYSVRDEAAMVAEIPQMMREAEAMRGARVAPDIDQRRAIADEVWAFVRRRGRKVYGGHALNAAILETSPADAIYDAERPPGDIEFYSPNPVADVYELCDRLFAAGHRFVQGREAAHHGTFTVSVEFVRVCDVTHVPQPIYDRLPAVKRGSSGLLTVSPDFSLIDHLRILCDPFTSHWKLDRMLPRLMLMQRAFPVALPPPLAFREPLACDRDAVEDASDRIREAILKWAAKRPATIAVVGEHAAAFFAGRLSTSSAAPPRIDAKSLVLVSVDYAADLAALAETVGIDIGLTQQQRQKQQREQVNEQGDYDDDAPSPPDEQVVVAPDGEEYYYCDDLEVVFVPPPAPAVVREFCPLIDLLGARAEFRVCSGSVVVTLVDARGKVVPVCAKCPRTGASIAGATYCVMTALAMRFADDFVIDRGAGVPHGRVAASIVASRAKALEAADTTVSDPTTVFRDVALDYIGEPLTDMRMHMAAADKRRLLGGPNAQVWFTYDPLRPGRHGNAKSRAARFPMVRCDGRDVTDGVESVLVSHIAEARVREALGDFSRAPSQYDEQHVGVDGEQPPHDGADDA